MTAAKAKTSIPAESTERVRDSPSCIATRGKGEDNRTAARSRKPKGSPSRFGLERANDA
jgi:hypothetical protein